MREKIVCAIQDRVQDISEAAVSGKGMEAVVESETDDYTYYTEIKEFLELENGNDVKDVNEWAIGKWGNNGVKFLARIQKRACHYCLLDGVLHHVKDVNEWAIGKWGNNGVKFLARIQKRACHYCLLDGVLHHGRENPKPVVMQKSEQQKILHELHVQEHTGIHNGVSKMYSALCAAYFWRGQYGDVKNFVRNCGNCIELPTNTKGYLPVLKSSRDVGNNSSSSKPHVISKDSQLGNCKRNLGNGASCKSLDLCDENRVWRKVEINLLGPYQKGTQKGKYLAVLVDPISHWISAQAILADYDSDQLSENVAKFVFSTFCTFGFPRVCSLVEECKLKGDMLWAKVENMMKRIKFSQTQATGKMTTDDSNAAISDNNPPTLLSLTGITLEQEARSFPPIELNVTSASPCVWAWELMEKYVNENEDTWEIGLDIFLFEERRNTTTSLNKCPFYHMYGRQPFHGDHVFQEKELKPKRRKLRSSVFECRHCQESFTSKISFHIHQKKHTEEAQLRGLIDEDTNDGEVSQLSSSELQLASENTSPKLPSNSSNLESVEDVSVSTSTSCQKSIHHRPMSTTSHRRKPHVKIAGGKKQYQRGITRLLNLAQVSRSLAAKGACDEIPKDSRRASFTAQTVASVRASLEAKRKKRTSRGNYQRYSPELREEIAKYAISHGTQQAVHHFSSKLGGKPISESTVRNFIKAHCSPTSHLNYFRNQGLEEEIGRFSAVAGTEAAIRCFSSRLGREIKRGTVCRLRRAYISKHPEDVAASKNSSKKKCESARRKRRFGALLRDEIGCYAAQHGVAAAVQHFSERLLFSVRERTVSKFLKLFMEKEASKSNLMPTDPVSGMMEKTSCISTHVSPPIDLLNSSLDVLGGLHQNNGIDRLDQGNSVSQLIYSEDGYSGLQHTLHHQQQSNNNMSTVAFHANDTNVYSDEQHSTNQVILDQGIPVSFCSSQDLSFSSVQNYPNYEHAGLQVSINSIGVDQSSGSVSLAIQSGQQGEPVSNVPSSHVLSQHSNMIVTHSSLIGTQNNSSSLQNNHQQMVLSHNGTRSEHVSPEEGQVLSTNHSLALTALLPSSSFGHTKNQAVLSSMINHSSENAVSLNDSAMASLQKSLVRDIDTSYYSLSLATPQSFQVENNSVSNSVQDSMTNKDNSDVVSLNSQHIILGETLMRVTLGSEQMGKSSTTETQAIGIDCDKDRLNEISLPLEIEENHVSTDQDSAVKNFDKHDASVPTNESNSLQVPEEVATNSEISKESMEKKKGIQSKKSKKVVQKPKRGTYTFYSPELRARIGRYAAEHGNLQASKHFQAEVGHQIPESTIRGLRDKYVMKQMQVAATTVSGGECGGMQKQVTALGYAPRGRPMRLGKYDEIVQDCMHELVNSGEKICSMLAIATARQVLTQYEPSLLEEFGGSIKLNNSWAKSFLKRMGLSNNS